MKSNHRKAMSRAVAIAITLALASPTILVKAAAGQVTRIGETDSYGTAAIVATTNWSSAKDVILVCGEGYADAVSASVLAKQLDAPILLTQASSLNQNAKDAIDKLKPQNIYIIGGNASVSQTIRGDLKGNNYNLIELGGKDRYETNVAVAQQLVKLGAKADNVILVSGEGFSDVLSATPIAAAKGQIILLGSNNKNTMKPVLDFIKSNNCSVTVIGTTYSINNDTYKAVGAVSRINGGADRFETNLNVLSSFNNDLNANKLFVANASGDRYADALIASSLAGKWSAPLVLVDDENAQSTGKALNYIKNKLNASTDLNVIGGSTIVSDKIVSQINSSVPVVSSPTVKSITSNGLNQIRIVFNTDVDEDSAENIKNYQIDGSDLVSGASSATLQDDKRTVVITFSNPYTQSKTINFKIKNAILDKNSSNTITSTEQKVTFSSTDVPTLKSVTPRGGNKLVVEFSQPIRLDQNTLYLMKINRQSVVNYGLNTTYTVFDNKCGVWTDKVELYFDGPLPEGNSVLTIPNGTLGRAFDNAAGFSAKSTSLTFNVGATVSGTPQVTGVIGDSSGTVYVTYDRPMDQQTALEDSNYKLNGNTISVSSDDISFDQNSNDTVVKIQGLSYLIKDGENSFNVDDDVRDTYGNRIKQTQLTFNRGYDSVKPRVTNVSMINDTTLRVKFNKDVSNSYATTRSNYTLIDSDGTDISYKISSINQVYSSSENSKRTYDIKFSDSDALKGSSYTLTIRNIIDTNSIANVMETYTTTISGQGNDGPSVTSVVKTVDNDQELVVFFDKVMDQSSALNTENYRFMDGNGDSHTLPTSATITPGLDSKSVIIDFPSGYIVGSGSGERYVSKLSIANVKDKDGNVMESYADSISQDYNNGPRIIDNTAKLTFDGNDIKVRVSLTAPLDILSVSDFRVGGQKPDNGMIEGSDVILTFKSGVDSNTKVDSIKNSGSTITISTSGGNSMDAAGRKLRSSSDTIAMPPITNPNSWRVSTNKGSYSNPAVTIVFNQEIDDDIRTSYIDDFVFKNETTGQTLTPLSVDVDNDDVIYKFNVGSIKVGDKIDIRANDQNSLINIRGTQHNGNYSVYSPSTDDLTVKTITVSN